LFCLYKAFGLLEFPFFGKIRKLENTFINKGFFPGSMDHMIEKANRVFRSNFAHKTCFERAIFFSWYCGIGDCAFCYMSTQPKNQRKPARRTTESLLAETFLCRKLGWDLGFVSGGHRAYTTVEFEHLLKNINIVYGEKVWINVGALEKEELLRFKPYIKGAVGSIETINPRIHEKVCPSKPITPFKEMFHEAGILGLKKAMTIIIGLGETISDFPLLEMFIHENDISKIHIYSLNPQKGTVFEKNKPPRPEYQAEWIARTRIAFPKIDIQAGIWLDKVDHVALLLRSGANSVSKFPAIKHFGNAQAQEIEKQARIAGRSFMGTLTRLPKGIETGIVDLNLDEELRARMKKKLQTYVKSMQKSLDLFTIGQVKKDTEKSKDI